MNQNLEPEKQKLGYAWYVVIILMLAYISSFIDRQILALLVKPIKRDLGISDTGMSLLMGFSFAIFYTFLGIPIGRLADSKSRKSIIAIGITIWCLMTALCGVAKNYIQLFMARIGVGVGEAALSPAAYSMISDYFPKNRLAFALSVYSMGIYIGSGLALVIAGIAIQLASVKEVWQIPIIGAIFPWQMVFFFVGLPGLLIAALMLTVREPERKNKLLIKDAAGNMVSAKVSFREVLSYISKNWKAFMGISLGLAFISMSGYGTTAWYPSYLQRNFGWSEAKAGLMYGSVITIFSTMGVIMGGIIADRLKKRGRANANVLVCAIAALGILLTGVFFPLMPTGELSVLLIIPPCFFTGFPLGAAAAAIQEIMPNQMRALASSIYFFILNLIALGFGPTAVALITDLVFQNEKMVGYSILTVGSVANLLAFTCLYLSLNPYKKSLRFLENYMQKDN